MRPPLLSHDPIRPPPDLCHTSTAAPRPYQTPTVQSGWVAGHFVADVWDTEGHFDIGKVSKEQLNIELENATLWRDYVDNTRNTPNKILVGEKN